MDNLLSLLIALIFLTGFATPLINKLAGKKTGLLLAIVPLSLFIVLLLELLQLAPRESALLQTSVNLLPGMDFAFRIDGLSLIFGLLITGIGTLVLLYAAFYMAKYERQAHFFTYLTLFMGAMIGLVFSDNLMVLFIFWEIDRKSVV